MDEHWHCVQLHVCDNAAACALQRALQQTGPTRDAPNNKCSIFINCRMNLLNNKIVAFQVRFYRQYLYRLSSTLHTILRRQANN